MNESLLDAVITDYLKAAEAGVRPDPEEWIARHPEHAAELRAFFDQHAKLQGLAVRLAQDATVAPDGATAVPTLRYVGDYELLAEIARGGMGIVFRARQVTLGREVAVKMMLSGALAGEADLARFRTEAQAAADLDHPNILPLYEVGEHEGLPYFSMKLVGGGSLAKVMPELTGDPRRAAKLMALVARAVHHAHQRGVLHRDLKPANVLLDRGTGVPPVSRHTGETPVPRETPYVSDFGLARRGADRGQTQTGQVLGTPSYMAPEQARAEKTLTVAVDVYALGAILYECLTGKPPFRAENVFDTMMQVIEKEPAHPRSLDARADADLSVIALKCLSKEPARRYASAAELADDLERWLRGEPILARSVGRGERLLKWMRRNPAIAALSMACALAVLIGTTTSTLAAFAARRQARHALEQSDRAHQGEAEARRRLARSHVISGNRLLEAGDDFGAMVWYAEAFELDAGDPEREKFHRLRLGLLMRHAPRLKQVTRVPEGEFYVDGTAEHYVSSVDQSTRAIRETKTGRLIGKLHSDKMMFHVEIGRDGKTLLAYASDFQPPVLGSDEPRFSKGTTLRLWNLADAKPLTPELLVKPGPNLVRLSADGKRVLAWLDDGRIAALDLFAGKEVFSEKAFGVVAGMQTTPDGQRLLVTEFTDIDRNKANVTLTVFDGATLAPSGRSFVVGQTTDYDPRCCLTPDGFGVIVAGPTEATWYDARNGTIRHRIPLAGVKAVAIDDKGRFAAVFGDQGTQAFDLTYAFEWRARSDWGRPSARPARHGHFSPDASTVVAVEGAALHEMRLYDRRSGRVLSPPLRGVGGLNEARFTADGRLFVVADSSNLLWTWEVTQQRGVPLAGPIASLTWLFCTDDRSRYYLSEGGAAQAYDGRTGKAVGPKMPHGAGAGSPIWPNDDGSWVVADEGTALRLWDAARGTSRPVPMGKGQFNGVTWLPGGRFGLQWTDDDKRDHHRLMDAETLQPVRDEAMRRVDLLTEPRVIQDDTDRVIAFDPPRPEGSKHELDGSSSFFVTKDKTLLAWSLATGKQRYSRKLSWAPRMLVIGPGDRLAVISETDQGQVELHLLDGNTGETIAPPTAVSRHVTYVMFSPDGRLLAVYAQVDECDVHVRDAATGQQLTPRLPCEREYALNAPPFSPDGRLLLTKGRLYDATTGDPLSPAGAFPIGEGGFRADGTGVLACVQESDRIRPPGDDRKIDPNLHWMMYEPLVWAEGTPAELLARAELLACRKVNAKGALADLTPDELRERWGR